VSIRGIAEPLCERRPFKLHLYGDGAVSSNPNQWVGQGRTDGWQAVDLVGPYSIRSMQVGIGVEFVNEPTVAFQVNTFFHHYGDQPPTDTNEAVQSRGVGEDFTTCSGRYWFRAIRLDIPMDLIFTPLPSVSVQRDTVDSVGMGNFHSGVGVTLATMANDGGDPTIPATGTYYFIGGYRPRKALSIYVPRSVYVNGGGANWTQAGDTVVDQTASGALIGFSFFFFATNLQRFNIWPPATAPVQGEGLPTLQGGDRITLIGDCRWVGPMILFNLNRSGPSYVRVENFT
jgi:hypothetical protein